MNLKCRSSCEKLFHVLFQEICDYHAEWSAFWVKMSNRKPQIISCLLPISRAQRWHRFPFRVWDDKLNRYPCTKSSVVQNWFVSFQYHLKHKHFQTGKKLVSKILAPDCCLIRARSFGANKKKEKKKNWSNFLSTQYW